VDFFHGVQVAIMFGLMTNIMQFAWWKVKGKKHLSYCARMKPVFILLVATVCVCFQPVSMLVIGSWDSVDNFFFDGGDANNFCTKGTECGSGACLSSNFNAPGLVKSHAGNPVPEMDFLWTNTGCDPISAEDWTNEEGGGSILLAVYGGYDVNTVAQKFYAGCQKPESWLGTLCHATDGGKNCTDTSKNTQVIEINNAGDGSFDTCFPYSKTFPVNDKSKEWKMPGTACVCGMNSNALVPNTTRGWMIQIFGTYLGFGLMFWGVFEATGLHHKIAKKWKKLRGQF